MRFTSIAVLCGFLALGANAAENATGEAIKQGHSHQGKAFDTGPRTKPWVIQGIGSAPFPITTKNPEVQKWFNQGNALLHSFWDYEAERSFRWALKLEPDNAMVYWGLARAAGGDRSKDFIREAAKRKHTVSERERLYIEALEAQLLTDRLRDRGDDYREQNREYKKVLESICVKYPDDMEARALLALTNMGDSRYGTEQIIQEILAKQPDHPGAHHYRIHNWNYHEPEQALESCRRYGEIAPGIGHALHMPGHVYATVGMWHEAAISMDSATRVEKRYMEERLTFPFNNWNYGHNRAYLSYIQEQIGMADAAMFGARQLIDAPLDPEFNADNGYSSHSQGITAMMRAMVKFERWEELLKSSTIPWRDIFMDKMNKAYVQARANLALGKMDDAIKSLEAHDALKKDLEKNKNFEARHKLQALDLKARLALAKGETLIGLGLLSEAAETQYEQQHRDNDPPAYPEVLYNALGREYLKAESPKLAADAFEKALKLTRSDIFALAGLVEAYKGSGETAKAEAAMSQLLFTASNADAGLALLERAKATGIRAEPKDNSPGKQRNYGRVPLDKFGPNIWAPYVAPSLSVLDSDGKSVSLDAYKGKNVILVFYLGRECPHCIEQLRKLRGKNDEWQRLEATVLAVSANTPEDNRRYADSLKVDGITLLSDPKFENAKHYQSYDDFEDIPLHSTVLIDRGGRVHWASIGGAPFEDMQFLSKQLERMNRSTGKETPLTASK